MSVPNYIQRQPMLILIYLNHNNNAIQLYILPRNMFLTYYWLQHL